MACLLAWFDCGLVVVDWFGGCYFPGVALRCVVLLLNLADYFGCGLVASGVCRFGGLGLVRWLVFVGG